MDMLKNRNVLAGVVFVLTTGIVMASLYVAKPAFCCQAQVNSSDPVQINWGIVSGMSLGIGAIASGVSFMLMPAPAGVPGAVAPKPMAFGFPYRTAGPEPFRFAMEGGSCKMGCGLP